MNDRLMTDVDFRKLMDEEKKARLDNEALKGATICVKIVNTDLIKILVRLRIRKRRLQLTACTSPKLEQEKKSVTRIRIING